MRYFSLCSSSRFWLKESIQHPALNRCWKQAERVEQIGYHEVQALQQEKIRGLLTHAVQTVPFYREWFAGSRHSLANLSISDFPVLSKSDFRGNEESFISDVYGKRQLEFSRTSGSTGEPFGFYRSKESFDYTYATLWRGLARFGIRPGDKRVFVKGVDELPYQTGVQRIRRLLYGWLNKCIVVDAHFLARSEENIAFEVQRILKCRPAYFHGYVSSIHLLARYIEEHRIDTSALSLKAIVTESEKCHVYQRECMERVFQCPVVENYGCVEFGMVAQPASDGTLCLNEDHVFVEVTDKGEAVLTNLDEYGFPLIRFKNGDLLTLGDVHPVLPYRTVKELNGRVAETIKLPNGGQLQGYIVMYPISKHFRYLKAYQVHQIALNELVVRLVISQALPDVIREQMVVEMREIVGTQMKISVELCEEIALSKRGKRAFVISDVE